MRKKLLSIGLIIMLIGSLAACSNVNKQIVKNSETGKTAQASKNNDPNKVAEKQAFKMDTTVSLKIYGSDADEALDAAMKRIDEIEQMSSSTIDTSDVCKINQAAGKQYVKVHPEVVKMIKTAIKYSELTSGDFDITVGPLIKLWGIGTEKERVPSDAEIKAVLPLIGYKNISINDADCSVKLMKEGMSIDLGGIGKGFTNDEILKVIKPYNITGALINLGGSSILAYGKKPDGSLWSVGIQHPREERNQGFLGIIRMPEKALSTSGDYERYFIKDGKRYHHILNPFTGYPADAGVISDSIVIDSSVPDCNMLADLLTKVTFVSGVEKGMKIIDSIPGVACIAETSDFKVYKSSAWKLQIDNLSKDFTMAN
ncbi:MAG: FAD:protein FMN transferase [Bacillota bacterium]|nr:FAD:protein FMN transferase [Bacillota bacterium]